MEFWINLVPFAAVYYTTLLGYGALMSVPVFGLIFVLRKCFPKKYYRYRLIVWLPLLWLPFCSRLRIYYENRIFVNIFFRWQVLCGEYHILAYLYLLGAAFLAAYFLARRHRLSKMLGKGRRQKVSGEAVVVAEENVGAFSFGVLRPRIVLSRQVTEEYTPEELQGLICHERTHIRLGHLLWLFLWDMMRVLYWVNPLFHLCLRSFKEDIELHCDGEVLSRQVLDPYHYGSLLVKQLSFRNQRSYGGAVSFADTSGRRAMQCRISSIIRYQAENLWRKRLAIGIALAFATAVLAFLVSRSYPRATYLEDACIYNPAMEQVLSLPVEEFSEAVTIGDGTVRVDRDALRGMLPAGAADEEWLFFSWGGCMKLPGIGGGGEGVFIEEPSAPGVIELPFGSTQNVWEMRVLKWM